MILILSLVSLLFSTTITLDNIAAARDLSNTTFIGNTITPSVDSIRYRSLLTVDTLISGNKSTSLNERQAAWPMITPMSERKFKFSYIWFCEFISTPPNPGNHLYEKDIELLPDNNSLSVTTPQDPLQAHKDSMGLLLTKRIPTSGIMKIGGMNAKAFATDSGAYLRILQGLGGTKDSLYLIDTRENANPIMPTSLMDSLINSQTYPDFTLNNNGDTLFSVFSPNNSRIIVTPFRINNHNTCTALPYSTILNDGMNRRDFGIARDPISGLFLLSACRTQGANYSIEIIRLSSNMSMLDSSQVENGLQAYPNGNARTISVTALGNNHFAVVYFRASGTFIKIINILNSIDVVSTVRLDPSISFVPNVYYSSGRLVVVWLRDVSISISNNCRVYGKIFAIENGNISDTLYAGPLSSKSTISENYANSPGANYRLGVALDSYGNLASSYVNQTDNRLYFNAHVPTFFFGDTGTFTLRDSIPNASYGSLADDSILYTGFSAVNAGDGNVELLFKSSPDGSFSALYVPVLNSSVLTTKGGSRFDFRLRMLTGAIASEGPRISSAHMNINVKPKLAMIDSIKIGRNLVNAVISNDTIRALRGTDSLRLYFSAQDYDNASYIQYYLSGYNTATATLQRITDYSYMGTTPIPPSNHTDTVYRLSFSVVDTNGWGSDSFHMFIRVHNPFPVDSVRSLVYTKQNVLSLDSLIRSNDTIFIIDSGYNVFRVFGRDSNNASLNCYYYVNNVLSSSVSGAIVFNDTIYADSVHGMDTVTTVLEDSYGAKDTTRFFVRVSHLPSLDSIYYKSLSNRQSLPLDSIRLRIKTTEADTFIIKARDPDIVLDDRLTFRLLIDGIIDTSCTVRESIVTFFRQPDRNARRIVISVSDQSGVTDSMVVRFLYPLTAINSYQQDSLYLADSLVAYTERRATTRVGVNVSNYFIAISSEGTDSLYVNSMRLKRRGVSGAFRIGTSFSRTGAVAYDTSLSVRKVPSGDTLFVIIRDSAAVPYGDSAGIRLSLSSGDTQFRDSMILTTNDPDYDTIIYPLRLLVKEPPFVVADSIHNFGSNRPLAIVYSEPMQRADTLIAPFYVYSYFDSLSVANSAGYDTTPLIPTRLSFSKGDSSRFDTLFLAPYCSTGLYRSSYFGLSPKDGLFIATDRIRVLLSANLRDLSGNRTDLDVDRMDDTLNARRVLAKNMDSSGLMIVSVSPDSGTIANASIPLISVTFSSPLDPVSIDSLLVGNRTVRIHSAVFPDTTLALLAPPEVNGNRLSFRPAGSMVGNDTITVTVSASIRDSNGNTLDANRDGVGKFFYNYGSSSYAIADTFMTSVLQTGGDNYTWHFYTGSQNFYIFPVPFEPSRNSRHAEQGGIIFKNIDALTKGKTDVSSVDLLIFTPDGVPVYSSAKHGETKSIGLGLKPTWKWNAVNNTGKSVASGLYVYCIVSGNNQNVLKRGKLVVIR